jgi:acyl-CoA reductase-like NAD-dependent aldehyde dehydrogenase
MTALLLVLALAAGVAVVLRPRHRDPRITARLDAIRDGEL